MLLLEKLQPAKSLISMGTAERLVWSICALGEAVEYSIAFRVY